MESELLNLLQSKGIGFSLKTTTSSYKTTRLFVIEVADSERSSCLAWEVLKALQAQTRPYFRIGKLNYNVMDEVCSVHARYYGETLIDCRIEDFIVKIVAKS